MPLSSTNLLFALLLASLLLIAAGRAWWLRRSERGRRLRASSPVAGYDETLWHALPADDALSRLQSTPDGLSTAEAQRRLAEHGPNCLPEARRAGPWARFLRQFNNALIYALLASGAVTALLEHWVDSAVIFGVVIINAIIGFIQEGKAEDALAAIRRMLSSRAMVRRDGRQIGIEAETLVPGDIVLLQPGDKVPADLRLLRARGLRIQEAALTGESVASEKGIDPAQPQTSLADRNGMAYSGTLVIAGQGSGLVVATGARTEIGRISALVEGVEELSTPLVRQMDRFARWLTLVILIIAAATFAFGVWVRGYPVADMFLAAVGLAVAAIPEGLPAIMTITLAIGVQRMARRNAIVRRLPAVESLGEVTVICSDKTGTLTRNEMTLRTLVTAGGGFEIGGIGYDPHGAFLLHLPLSGGGREGGEEIDPASRPELIDALRAALLCNDSALAQKGDEWEVHGDPMEGALLVAGMKAGLEAEQERLRFPRDDLIPFDSEHKFMATLHHGHDGASFLCAKGAPEQILARCDRQRGASPSPPGRGVGERATVEPFDPAPWLAQVEELAAQGQRVLAVATRPLPAGHMELTFADLEGGLILLGLFGLIDPPRDEAIQAVAQCRAAGIRVIMITGDHAATARAIARRLDLANTEDVLTGAHLERLSDEGLRERVGAVDIYARVSPEHKLRLVTLLQARGEIVAMTGDGVNDAPALKRADVGVAMGEKGTEVAKDAAEMVLADDNFATIAHAVEEGRTIYDNLRKAILFALPTNGGEGLVLIAAILLGFEQLPLTPVQVLWVNMVTAVTLALALAFEPAEAGVMQRPPRPPGAPLLTPLAAWRIAFVSLLLTLGTFGLFIWESEQGAGIERARTVAVNTLVAAQIFYLFNSRYILAPVLNRAGLFGNPYVWLTAGVLLLFQLAFTYLPPMQALFGTEAIGWPEWLRIVIVGSGVLWLVEIEKALLRRRLKKPEAVL